MKSNILNRNVYQVETSEGMRLFSTYSEAREVAIKNNSIIVVGGAL